MQAAEQPIQIGFERHENIFRSQYKAGDILKAQPTIEDFVRSIEYISRIIVDSTHIPLNRHLWDKSLEGYYSKSKAL